MYLNKTYTFIKHIFNTHFENGLDSPFGRQTSLLWIFPVWVLEGFLASDVIIVVSLANSPSLSESTFQGRKGLENNDSPVAMDPPHSQILVFKFHLPLKEVSTRWWKDWCQN